MRFARKMTSMIALLLVVFFTSTALAVTPEDYNRNTPAVLEEGHLNGEAAVIMDAETAEILLSKNSRVRMYPASTTKIMTLLLAVESGWSFETIVTVPAEAAQIANDSSKAGVYPGDVLSFGDLLYGMMLPSGNDAANAIAVLVGGSLEGFVQKMNQRAQELGCIGTHFTNAHGYHDENHYSTAYDLALITREALRHESVRTIASTSSYTMNISGRGQVPISNSNVMLLDGSSYYYPECIGMKTGTHSRAGNCFVGVAEKDGVTLITVTMKCLEKIPMWIDTIRLYNYGFTRYTPYSLEQMFDLIGSRITTTRVSNAHEDDPYDGVLQLRLAQVSDAGYERMIQSDSSGAMSRALDDFYQRSDIRLVENLSAPISAGEIVGSYTYSAQSGEVITATLIAGRDIAAQPERVTVYDVFPFLQAFENPLVALLAIILVLLLVVYLLYRNARRRRQERRRRELYEKRRREYLRRHGTNSRSSAANASGTRANTPQRRRIEPTQTQRRRK